MFIVADVLWYTLPLRLFWQPDFWQISVVVLRKMVFPQLLPIFYICYNFIKVLQIFSLHEIEAVYQIYPWNQITLSSLPPANPLPILLACEEALRLGKG